jgi:glycosyltransferase involved in cell wall biosynthesis
VKIAIVATHTFPLPPPTHTGDVVILDLAVALQAMGHEVTMCAPEGTKAPGRLLPMPCSFGKYPPSSEACEQQCFNDHAAALRAEDVVHDFSNTKRIAEILASEGRPTVSTLLGGAWAHPAPPRNICVWSEAMRQRGLRGATDYEGTPTPGMGGSPGRPIKDAHVVHGGIDTDWYTPEGAKESFFLWVNRWHPAKGYRQAIELARATGIELVMAGEHPDNERFEYQKNCALEAVELAKGLSNVRFQWLPADPDHHTAKRDLYRRARALVYSIRFQEPFGLSQIEALACGTPVIGVGYGSVPEVIEDGKTGLVVEDSIDELATAIKKVDAIDPLYCRTEAIRRFDRKVMARAYCNEYRAVIEGRGWGVD